MRMPVREVPSLRFHVHTKPRCPQCSATLMWLSRRDLFSIEIDDPDELMAAASRAHVSTAPVVEVVRDGKVVDSWGGFRPELIDVWAEGRVEG